MFLTIEAPRHWVGVMALLIYLNSTEGLVALLPLVQEKCFIFGNKNENFYK